MSDTYSFSQVVEQIKKIYVGSPSPQYKKLSKKTREDLLPLLIRKEAIKYIKIHPDVEMGLRNLPGWRNGIKFALQSFDPVMYQDIDEYLQKGTELISNDLQ